MKRRTFFSLLAGAAAAAPLAALAQSGRTRRVAWLGLGRPDLQSPYVEALRGGLSELGWSEGGNLTLSLHWARGRNDMEAAARELLASNPDVVVTQELMTYALQNLKTPVPVVFGFSGDPVDGKLVESYSRPGGTMTGMSYLALDLVGKRVELLKDWIPQIQHLGILARPQHPGDPKERQATEVVVHKLGMQLSYFPYVAPSLPATEFGELEKVFRAIEVARCDALMIFPDSAMFEVNDRVAKFAIDAKLPTVSGWSPFARDGLLLSYGPNVRDLYRSLARYVDRILRGAKPSDLPVEVPRNIELVINAKTAKAIGLEVPLILQQRADEVID